MAPPGPASEREFRTCRFCGEAVAPELSRCAICGEAAPIRAADVAGLPKGRRYRFRFVQGARVAAVVGVVAVLAVLLAQAALTPAPTAADPLTQSSTLSVAPGASVEIAGYITGSDFIQGNYTVIDPPGAVLTLAVYNDSEYAQFLHGVPAVPRESVATSASRSFVFAAPYTDTYHFVWSNAYPTGSGLKLTFFVRTAYEPNVVIGELAGGGGSRPA